MTHEATTGLRRIAQELRAATIGPDRRDPHTQADAVRAELARLWSEVETLAGRSLRPAAQELREDAWAARDAARDAAQRLGSAARAHPLAAIGIAALAAVALTSLLRPRR
jgi:ElaB/YqjD/DUF883 family membrane-anchored ribosome-binding protein